MTDRRAGTIIAVTGDDARYKPVLDRAIGLARAQGASIVLYDLYTHLSPFESPLPTEWSGEGEEEQFGKRLDPDDLEVAGQAGLARRVRAVRSAGVDADGWLAQAWHAPDRKASDIVKYAAGQSADTVLVSTEDGDLIEALESAAADGKASIRVEAVGPDRTGRA